MSKYLLFSLILFLFLSETLTDDSTLSPCAQAVPTNPQDCYSLKGEFLTQTCCYFEGKYKDLTKEETKEGPGCLEAFRSDVNNGANKAETQKKIEAGTYWENYPPITDLKAFNCFDEISECEKIQPAKNEDSCIGAHAELNNEICCYIESDWTEPDGTHENNLKYCVDIVAADVETEEKKQATIEKIKAGTYWDPDTVGKASTVAKLVCKKAKSSSSSFLFINLLTIALGLLII